LNDAARLPSIEPHRLCRLFPAMAGQELGALIEDVAAHGVRQRIVLFAGQILDGRNRYAAACAAGLPDADLPFARFEDGEFGRDPLAFVLSQNLHRRHLSESQRAMVAAEVANLGHGGVRRGASDQVANLPLETEEAVAVAAVTQAEAAEMLQVSKRSVGAAGVVLDQGAPVLQEAVRAGEVSVSVAAAVSALPVEEQVVLVARGEAEILAKAKLIRKAKSFARHYQRQRKGEAIAAKKPGLPGRLFPIVLIDVPRASNSYDEVTGSEKAPTNHYPCMSFRELLDFPINDFAAPDCVIGYWSTAASLLDDLEILAEWGFVAFRPRGVDGRLLRDPAGEPLGPVGGGKYGSQQVWHKQRVGNKTGMGRWFRDQHEFLLFARRGNIPAPLPGTQSVSCFDAEFAGHSVKPHDFVRGWIDRCWPEMAKIEIFARGEAPAGWTFWGNQAGPRDAIEPSADVATAQSGGASAVPMASAEASPVLRVGAA